MVPVFNLISGFIGLNACLFTLTAGFRHTALGGSREPRAYL